jgi:hypothetical protein
MNDKPVLDPKWSKLISLINGLRPQFGTLTIELTFHNDNLSRARVIDKINMLVFNKEDKNE